VPLQADAFVPEHCAQAPLAWHAGVAPPHSPSLAQARQLWVAVLQTGVVLPHCAFDVQGTQVAVGVLQTGVAPLQSVPLVAEHWPQAPLAWHAGVEPPHSPSPPQARQVWVPPSQTGAFPEQSALATQRTQLPALARQTGVAPVQSNELPAEHWPHEPPGWQAGVTPPHSLSPPQARQVRNDGSQTGVDPPQSALATQPTHSFVAVLQTGVAPPHWLLARHWTQVAIDVSQTGVDPPQSPMLVAEQAPHAPEAWQAGAVPGHCESEAQGWHVCVPVLQTGFVPPQFVSERQATQTRGETVPRQYGVAPLQSLVSAHCSTRTLVGDAPEPPPLPTVR
jgi:hypothetical protein